MPEYPVERIKMTYEERATFGTCPACGAGPGKWCDGAVGLHMGYALDGKPPADGVHLGRLQAAPRTRVISYEE